MVPAALPPDAAQLADPRTAKIWKSAQDFEAMALGSMLKPMFATVDGSATPLGGGEGEQTWRPMMVDEMAKGIAAHGGLGIAAPVFHQMLLMQEAKEKTP